MLFKLAQAINQRPINEAALMKAIGYAETGAYKNPWIRTKYRPPGGSTAWWPYQLTYKTVRDTFSTYPYIYRNIKKRPNLYKFVKQFMHQGELFKTYGAEPNKPGYKPIYDYGGKGIIEPTEENKRYYEILSRLIFKVKKRELKRMGKPITPATIAAYWRGKQDKAYINKVVSKYKELLKQKELMRRKRPPLAQNLNTQPQKPSI